MPSITPHVITYHSDGRAEVTTVSTFTGRTHTMWMPLTQEEYENWLHGGGFIQRALPHLNADQREFLLTGATPEEWHAAFGDDD